MGLQDGNPLRYTEIAKGNFDRMMQEMFLKAHKLSNEYNQKVVVEATIQVFPPDPRSPASGNISYSVQLKEPKYTSQKFTTALVGGLPVKDGKNMLDAEQYSMFDKDITEEEEEVDSNYKPITKESD